MRFVNVVQKLPAFVADLAKSRDPKIAYVVSNRQLRDHTPVQFSKGAIKLVNLDIDVDPLRDMLFIEEIEPMMLLKSRLGAQYQRSDRGFYVEFLGLKFELSTYMQSSILCEIFIDEAYSFESTQKFHVLDIGANHGFASIYFASQKGFTSSAFELFPGVAEVAREQIALNPSLSDKIRVYAKGVGGHSRQAEFPFSATHSGGRGMFNTDESSKTDPLVKCDIVALEEAIAMTEADANGLPLLLKIDCEGAEYEIFESMARQGLQSKFECIVGEYHEIGKDLDYPRLRELLHGMGYTFQRTPSRQFPLGAFVAWKSR